jgi:hypothetical protein
LSGKEAHSEEPNTAVGSQFGRGTWALGSGAGAGDARNANWNAGNNVKRDEILEKLAAGELSVDEASQLLAESDRQPRGSLYCKVSQKGALSVYGLQRMPVTLYVEQWERLLEFADEIRQFAQHHAGELSRKKSGSN